jgi:hypothetical protein
MTSEQERAVAKVAKAFGWDEMTTGDIDLMLWALFRYYAARLKPAATTSAAASTRPGPARSSATRPSEA